MIVDNLKISILEQAIRGKLVSNNHNSELVDEELKGYYEKYSGKKENVKEYDFELPSSWRWVKLGNISFSNIGLTYKPSDVVKENGTPVLRSNNIQDGKFVKEDLVRVNFEVPESKKCLPNDIIMCSRNGSKRLVGKCAIIDEHGYSFGAFMAIIRSDINKYLYYVFNSNYFRKKMLGDASTTTINQITQKMLYNFYVPIPPLEEQNRIVKKIEQLFCKLDEVKPLELQLNDLKSSFSIELKKSIFNSIFSKYESNTIELGNISCINGGYAFKSINYTKEGIRVIRISDFDENGIKNDNIVRYKYDDCLKPYKLEPGSIIICMTGGTVGKNIILDDIPDDYYTNQRVATIKVNKNFIPKFVYYCINAPFIQQMIQNSKNSTNDNISMPLIKSFPIPNISIDEQNNVIREIEQFLPLCQDINLLINE